jgi:hypothetical protein
MIANAGKLVDTFHCVVTPQDPPKDLHCSLLMTVEDRQLILLVCGRFSDLVARFLLTIHRSGHEHQIPRRDVFLVMVTTQSRQRRCRTTMMTMMGCSSCNSCQGFIPACS